MSRGLHLALGLVCVGLGVLGVFLPVLPTTPFLLVALWAFSRSSRRLERWLSEHPRFGPRLRSFREHRVVPLPVKLTAWTTMAASLILMVVSRRVPWPGIAATAALMLAGVIYVARCPSRPPASDVAPRDVDAA
jgi:uncharacterized protein